ncbi:uncharacterized protein I206_106887 [Kwoniella pini CBS 10737]|uniref:Uncharacterized protein n=1 Tax=Kwoniella pini CBS 10737 TaxID=1296096 RepID=A0A1B9HZS9_9TREE|nr:uncharacterized protein I206_05567 [Kwoniella pini CBS 10737]OCF48786.1 hypothetical protein I206_05567 [Kwoniella pini CBS 10737]
MSDSSLPNPAPTQGDVSSSSITAQTESTNTNSVNSSSESTQNQQASLPNGMSNNNAEAGPSHVAQQIQNENEDVVMENGDLNSTNNSVPAEQSNENRPNGTIESNENDKKQEGAEQAEQNISNPHTIEEEDTRPDLTELFAARREEELARRDRSLVEFLSMLEGYKPLIPEEVTEYYLQRSGFECSDPRLKRLLSLSAQKFISDLSRDAYHFAKLRVNGTNAGGRGRPVAGVDRNRVVLTMDDLSLALGEHGVNVKKPDYCESLITQNECSEST